MFNIEEFKEKIKSVPFGNSQFQIRNFIAKEYENGRALRTIYLQVWDKIKCLENNKYDQELKLIDIEEMKESISKMSTPSYEKRRLEIKLKKELFNLECSNKSIADALEELKVYFNILETLPKEITREEFEKEEFSYWKKRLGSTAARQIASMGTIKEDVLESLEKMGVRVELDTTTKEVRLIDHDNQGN